MITNNNFIIATEKSDEDYDKIIEMINNRPEAPEGFRYRLTTDFKWELCEVPPVIEEPTEEEVSDTDALNELLEVIDDEA